MFHCSTTVRCYNIQHKDIQSDGFIWDTQHQWHSINLVPLCWVFQWFKFYAERQYADCRGTHWVTTAYHFRWTTYFRWWAEIQPAQPRGDRNIWDSSSLLCNQSISCLCYKHMIVSDKSRVISKWCFELRHQLRL